MAATARRDLAALPAVGIVEKCPGERRACWSCLPGAGRCVAQLPADRGQRLTPQRQRVLALFERLGEGSHLSAEEVHQRLLKADERVSWPRCVGRCGSEFDGAAL